MIWFNFKDSIMVQTFEILDHHEGRSRSSSWFYHHLRDSARSRRWSQFSEFPRSIWKWTDEFGKLIPKTRSYKIVTNAKLFENIHLLLKSTKIRLTPTIQFDPEFYFVLSFFLENVTWPAKWCCTLFLSLPRQPSRLCIHIYRCGTDHISQLDFHSFQPSYTQSLL